MRLGVSIGAGVDDVQVTFEAAGLVLTWNVGGNHCPVYLELMWN